MARPRAEDPDPDPHDAAVDGTWFVMGKGGVGKSVIAEGLAFRAASAGDRALLVRIGESLEPVPLASRQPSTSKHGFDVVELDAGVAMDEFVRHVVRLRPLAERITGSEIYRKFFAAAPGLPELVLLGRIREYARETDRRGHPRWKCLIVDSPSSGHGLLMLETPFAAFRAVRVGPFARLAAQIMDWLQTATRIALVAIPEEMAVVEAIEFRDELLERTGLKPAVAYLNRMRREKLSAAACRAIVDTEAAPRSLDGVLLECAARAQRRERLEGFHHRRLMKGLGLKPVLIGELPHGRPASVALALAEATP